MLVTFAGTDYYCLLPSALIVPELKN